MKHNIKSGVYTRDGQEFAFNFYTSLNAANKMKFTNEFTNLVIIDGDYYAAIKDMAFGFTVINVFTDVDTSFIYDEHCEDPIGEIESLVNDTNILDIVSENIEHGVLESLRDSVELNVEYKTGIHRNMFDESLSGLVNAITEVISNIDVEEVMKVGKMIGGVSGELTPSNLLKAYAESDMYKKEVKKEE